MDQLWEVTERDLHDGPSGGEEVGYNRNKERMEVDGEQKEEGEGEEEESEETESWDGDVEGQHSQDEEEQPQSMKRHRRKRPRQDSGGDSGGPSAEQGESEKVFKEDDGHQEVIEIFDDDEEARSSTGRGSRGCDLSDFSSPSPPGGNPAATASATATSAMEPSHPFTSAVVARAGDLFYQTGVSPSPAASFGLTSSSSSSNSSSTKKDVCSDPTGTSRIEPSRQPVGRKPSLPDSSRRHAWRSLVVPSRARSPLGEARGEGKKDVHRLGEKMPAAKQSWSESGGSGEQSAEAELSGGQASSRLVKLANNTPATRAATATTTASEFPVNLECPMCFNPLAVVALFACGHGACWECAHDWCGRGTTPTMDCPACHVSIPRNGFRRCIVLDQVVENAVMASGLEDAEWHGRLQRGRGLARRAEASRRSAREVQRSAEETIAKQAEELERLRQEAKSRSLGRGRRSHEGFSPPMAEFGFHLVGNGHDRHDRLESSSITASPGTSSFEDSLFRPRQPRTEPAAHMSRGEAAAAATAATAASLRVLPSDPGGVHPRLQTSSSSSSSFGLAMNNPWFSFRPSLSRQQHAGVSMSAMRVGHEAYGRSSASTRSYASSIVPGVDAAAGAALKSEHERRYPTGQHRAHPSRPSGSAADDAVTSGARARNAALSSLYAFSEDMRNSAMSGATLPPGRRLQQQVPSARSSRKRYSPRSSSRGMNASAAAMSIAGATASSSSSSFSMEAGPAAVATSAAVGSPTPPDRFGLGSPGNDLAISRFEGVDSDLDALDMISSHDDFGARPSEWDDVLAAVSMPLQESDDSQPKTRG